MHFVLGTLSCSEKNRIRRVIRRLAMWERYTHIVLNFSAIAIDALPCFGKELANLSCSLERTGSAVDICVKSGGFYLTNKRARRRKRVSLMEKWCSFVLTAYIVET